MLHSRCAFCWHENPAGSKFCNECGSPLHLKPCAQCDAVNDYEAAACYRCNASFAPSLPEQTYTNERPAHEPRTSVLEAFGESLSSTIARTDAQTIDRRFGSYGVGQQSVSDVGATAPASDGGGAPDIERATAHVERVAPDAVAAPFAATPASDVATAPVGAAPAPEAASASVAQTASVVQGLGSASAAQTVASSARVVESHPQDTAPASPDVTAESLVVPPDEARLAAARDVAAARRRRRTRAAIAAVIVVAAAGGVYYEYFAANPVGDWLRATYAGVIDAVRSRIQPAAATGDDATRAADAPNAQPPTKPDDVAAPPAPATPSSADNAAPSEPPATSPSATSPSATSPSATSPPPSPTTATEPPAEATPTTPNAVSPSATEQPPPKKSARDRKRRATRGSPAALASPTQVARGSNPASTHRVA